MYTLPGPGGECIGRDRIAVQVIRDVHLKEVQQIAKRTSPSNKIYYLKSVPRKVVRLSIALTQQGKSYNAW